MKKSCRIEFRNKKYLGKFVMMAILLLMQSNKNKCKHIYLGKAKYLYMPSVRMIQAVESFAAGMSCLHYPVTEKRKKKEQKCKSLLKQDLSIREKEKILLYLMIL